MVVGKKLGLPIVHRDFFLTNQVKKLFTSVTTLAILVISYDDPGIP